MFEANRWISENCKFAAPNMQPAPANPAGSHPMAKPSLSTEPTDQPATEDELAASFMLDSSREQDVRLGEVFQRMAEDVKRMQDALAYVENPSFPSFTEAYRKAFGSHPPGDVARLLGQMELFFSEVASNPKFAEMLAKSRKTG